MILQSTSCMSQDSVYYRSLSMDSNSDSIYLKGPQTSSRRPSGGQVVSEVFGFPVEENQFSALSMNQLADSQRSTQREVGLVNPRTTRHLRWAAARTDNQESKTKQAASAIVPTFRDIQGNSSSGTSVYPGVSVQCSQYFENSFLACSPDILSQQSGGSV